MSNILSNEPIIQYEPQSLRPIVATIGVLFKDGKVLLVRRATVFVNIVVTQFNIKRLKPHWH